MGDKEFQMYGEYAGIVDFVGGNLLEAQCTFQNQNEAENIEFDFDLAHVEDSEYNLQSELRQVERLDTISAKMQIGGNLPLILVLGQPPFHVEYVSTAWTSQYGWSSEEIVGLDLNFLRGDGAIGINVKALYDVAYTEKKKTANITGYMRDGTIFSCSVILLPVYDTDSSQNSTFLTNIAIEFGDLQLFPDFPSDLLDYGSFNEIGMPLDRREYSTSYRHRYGTELQKKPMASVDFTIASKIAAECSLSDIVRYMSTSETNTAMALTDRNGKFIHINQTFASLFKVSIGEIEGKEFDILFHDLTDEETKKLFYFGKHENLTALSERKKLPVAFHQMKKKRKENLNAFSRSVFLPELRSRSTSGENNFKINKEKQENKFQEFTSILSNKMKKVMTCRVIIIPTAISTIKLIGSNNVHFTICLHKLFLEEMFEEKLKILSHPSELTNEENLGSSFRPYRGKTYDNLEPLILAEKPSTDFAFLSPEIFPLKDNIPTDDSIWDS